MYYTTTLGWTPMTNADLIVRAFITGQPNDVAEPSGLPFAYSLHQNYPNPFNPATIIKFTIPVGTGHAASVLKVYDLLGREVATLVNEVKEPGAYTVHFDATSLASGAYFYKLQSGAYTAVRRMMLVK
ncbi:MAG: T9SS type A sorting domain-containing protein [Ignavibacteriae bacterium]|nr:T9SS type A sorting domain-containing protein [Ignavibacteriota bacterium]